MKVPELKAEAKRLGLNNYSRLKKQELIDLLNNQTERTDDRKLPELKAEAKRLGLNNYSRLKKQELIDLLNNQRTPPIEPSERSEPSEPRKKIPAPPKIPAPTKKIPSPPKKISPKELENKIKRLKKKLRVVNQKLKNNKKKKRNLHQVYLKSKLENELDEIKRPKFRISESASALRGFARQFRIEGIPRHAPREFLQKVRINVQNLMRENRQTRVRMILNCEMTRKELFSESTQILNTFFHSETVENLEGTDEREIYDGFIQTIEERIQNFNQRGSNWRFERVLSLDIHFTDFQPLRGSTFLPLPSKISTKKAVINMKNNDDQCFKWSVTRALNPVDVHPERVSKELKDQSERLDWSGLKFPVKLDQIIIFEKNNPQISINVFGFEGDVYPLRLSKRSEREQINLLLISDGEKQHYCLIKSLSRLLSSQVSGHKESNSFCLNCLNHFPNEEKLKIHEEYCLKNQAIRIEMPEKGSLVTFIHHNRSIKVPFVVYADFEAFTEEIPTCEQNEKFSFTQKYQKHKPSGFCFKIVCFDEKYNQKPVLFRARSEDEDVSAIFVEMLERDIKRIQEKFDFSKKMIFSPKDKDDFEKARVCWICRKEFGESKKQRDHCHFTGKYRGAAHVKCNLQFKKPKFTPVIFHNLSGYDAHLFVKNLGRTEGNIKCIPNNEEKYISFSKEIVVGEYKNKKGEKVEVKHEIRFLDSFKFMASSLESLVGNLGLEKLIQTKKEFGEKVKLISRKGIYPYDYMNGIKKFSEETLPAKEKFFSKLNDCGISDEDYEHAQRIWKEFGIKDLGEYHDLYLKSDVLLLADVFEEFRNVCMENYSLDPAWYYTSPGLSWDALLKHSRVSLELLTDPDILLLFEKGIRGGISMISNRFGKANNKYMGEKYDPRSPSKYLAYLDANNLYGWAMMKPLPVGDFKWMNEKELGHWGDFPCILEVDLEYPRGLHDLHNDYPLAPERLKIGGVEKLIPNLWDKKKYIVHHENLELYLELGLKVKKIHRGIKFREEPWMRSYIELNTSLRTKGKNDFEKDFFKLMNNSVFGKTMENIRNRVDVKLVNNRGAAEKLSAKPNFEKATIFDEGLVAIHMKRTKLTFNKPVYCGMAILDLSKSLMYDFHYGYILPKYGKNQKLLFTDTDSLCYEIQTEDFYKDISEDVEKGFDTSNFPKDHPSGIQGKNKKVPGMMKDEAGGRIIEEFVGLRAKLYSYKMFEGKEEKKCKGIKKSVIKKNISHEDYKECLFSGASQMRKMNVIRSRRHEIFSETVNKIALSANDDKRIILEDKISTLSYGHYKI